MNTTFRNYLLSLVGIFVLFITFTPTFAAQQPISLVIEGKSIGLDVAPQVVNGRTLLPLRAVFENLGATVTWNEKQGEVIAKRGFTTVRLYVDKKVAIVNGQETKLDAAPMSFQKRVLVPTRFVAESLGADVVWDEKKRVVTVKGTKKPLVKIEMADGGTVTMVLYPDIAPNTVNNFLSLAKSGFYDGLIFHRIIPGFMIQGGDPLGQGIGNPGYRIAGEFELNQFKNELRHTRGVVSMARSSAFDSAGSQFFIMVAEASYLDGSYAAFGKVISGMDVVDRLVELPRDTTDRPKTPPVMKKVTVETLGVSYPEPKKIKLQ